MRFFLVMVAISIVCNAALGTVIFSINPRRRVNRTFFVLSGFVLLWLCTLLGGALTRDHDLLTIWIRAASFTAAMIPVAFDFLRLAIVKPTGRWDELRREVVLWLCLVLGVAILCPTDFFVYGNEPGPSGFVHAKYGPGQFVYLAFWITALGVLITRFVRDCKRVSGMARTELGFMVFAAASSVGIGVIFAQVLPYITGNPSTPQLTPFVSTLLLMGIVGYGVSVKRIMSVGSILQRVTAYCVLLAYLCVVYFACHKLVSIVFSHVGWSATFLPGFLASVAVAFSVVPVRGWMKRVVNLLFSSLESMDIAAMMREAQRTVLTLGTQEDLARQFARIIAEAAGPSHVVILLVQDGRFTPVFAAAADAALSGVTLTRESPVIRAIEAESLPVTVELLRRSRPTTLRMAALDELQSIGSTVALGVHAHGQLEGVLLLGRRTSGKIYSAEELDALQIISNQLAVAVENSKLYTQVQDARIYHETLVGSLRSGIVATDMAGRVTVFNREAERVTGLRRSELIGRTYEQLPKPLAMRLLRMLETGEACPEEEVEISAMTHDPIPVRMGGTLFTGHRGGRLGVLLAFQDIGLLRRLEQQVRRNDRLSSLGTLSAGMAHEIKNPLVTIKTFTQLLPERHDDEEFRSTFFELISQEVVRIDSIVNRLLNFARPAKAELKLIHLREVVDNALKLVEHPLRSKQIALEVVWHAACDKVRGDQELLIQVLINLFLNAVEAMPGQGALTVTAENTDMLSVSNGNGHGGDPEQAIRLSIRDTGCGIADEDLPHVFDPFFTRTSNGTGLGLSIVHGIIQEHHSTIEVESEPGEGTVFHILLPISEEQEAQV